MNGLTTIKWLINRGALELMLVTIAAFISLAALPAPVHAQSVTTVDAAKLETQLSTFPITVVTTRPALTLAPGQRAPFSFALRGDESSPAQATGTATPRLRWYLAHLSAAGGQTVRIRIEAADAAGSSSIVVWQWDYDGDGAYDGDNGAGAGAALHVRAFSGSTGAVLWSREVPSLTPGRHTFDINRDELREAGEPETGSLPLWIEVLILPHQTFTTTEGAPIRILAPTLEMINPGY